MISVRFSSRSEAMKCKDSALNRGFMEGERQKKDNGRSCRGDRRGWRIRSVPWKMTLPFTISPMMQPTDQISTEWRERHRNINRQNDFISAP